MTAEGIEIYVTQNVTAGKVLTSRGEVKSTVDDLTGGAKVITTDHANIHGGMGFQYSLTADAVANAGSINIEFTTPEDTKYIHLKQIIPWGEGGLNLYEIKEGNTSTGGTAASAVNKNRVGTPLASTSALKTGVTPSGGTTLESAYFGGGGVGQGAAGNTVLDNEWVLKPETAYVISVTNNSGAAKALSLYLFWYEEAGTP